MLTLPGAGLRVDGGARKRGSQLIMASVLMMGRPGRLVCGAGGS